MFKPFRFSLRNAPHLIPVLLLFALCALWWHRVLVGPNVLLPGEMLRGFAPFGDDARAPWNILQWDGMAQYFPWRVFAARELQAGQIPLWNPHQFAGTPFLANSQSAVFYPLNFPFWTMDVARAFGVSAWLHSLLATISTYFLAQHWKLSRAASLLAAVAFGFAGYLAFWATLPTLSNCASWIPLLVLLLERATHKGVTHKRATHKLAGARVVLLSAAIACALLAGHAQIFFYTLLALFLRALTLPRADILRAQRVLVVATAGALCLSAMQLLPTLEMARLGHRAGQSASAEGWDFVARNALQMGSLPSLFVPAWPQLSFDENRGYVGFVAPILALCACGLALFNRLRATSSTRSEARDETIEALNVEAINVEANNSEKTSINANGFRFALTITIFALLFATATPLAQLFYFQIPGLSQMGGVGRALILWSLGIALCAAFGLDFLRAKLKSNLTAPLAVGVITLELFAAGWNTTPTAPRATIYPPTILTTFLQNATKDGARVLFLTPRRGWFASEDLPQGATRTHPTGVLPPNGATVYNLNDVNGYDSLSSGAFRQYLIGREGADISPPRNGNMVLLNNLDSRALDELNVRFVVSQAEISRADLTKTLTANGCIVYRRNTMNRVLDVSRKSGRDFFPGWTSGENAVYNPQSFRVGVWISLGALLMFSFVTAAHFSHIVRHSSFDQ